MIMDAISSSIRTPIKTAAAMKGKAQLCQTADRAAPMRRSLSKSTECRHANKQDFGHCMFYTIVQGHNQRKNKR